MRKLALGTALAGLAVAVLPSSAALSQTRGTPEPVTVVSDLLIKAPEVEIPRVGPGAPVLSSEQLGRFSCQARHRRSAEGYITRTKAELAKRASEQARHVRRLAAGGRATQAEVVAAELRRQEAVRAFQTQVMFELRNGVGVSAPIDDRGNLNPALGIDPYDLPLIEQVFGSEAAFRLSDALDPGRVDTRLENVSVRLTTEGERPVLRMQGVIRNLTNRRVKAPNLMLSMYDKQGRMLEYEYLDPQGTHIPAGQRYAFNYRLKSPGAYTDHIQISFTSGAPFVERRFHASC